MPDKKPVKLFADYEEHARKQVEADNAAAYDPQRPSAGDKQTMLETGESPEMVAMVDRLVSAGLDPSLAVIAAKQMMGLSSKDTEWSTYEKQHPVMANSKKLLDKGSIPLRGVASAAAAPVKLPDAEKLSAHKMLKEYLHAQDMQRANEVDKEGLWMLARMPGAPLAGQPVYGGPMTAGPIDPLRTPEQATQNNQLYAAQANRRY